MKENRIIHGNEYRKHVKARATETFLCAISSIDFFCEFSTHHACISCVHRKLDYHAEYLFNLREGQKRIDNRRMFSINPFDTHLQINSISHLLFLQIKWIENKYPVCRYGRRTFRFSFYFSICYNVLQITKFLMTGFLGWYINLDAADVAEHFFDSCCEFSFFSSCLMGTFIA